MKENVSSANGRYLLQLQSRLYLSLLALRRQPNKDRREDIFKTRSQNDEFSTLIPEFKLRRKPYINDFIPLHFLHELSFC